MTIPKFPNEQQIGTAILWLQNNEGDEAADCKAVADWLEAFAVDRQLKIMSREAGVPIGALRKRLRESK